MERALFGKLRANKSPGQMFLHCRGIRHKFGVNAIESHRDRLIFAFYFWT